MAGGEAAQTDKLLAGKTRKRWKKSTDCCKKSNRSEDTKMVTSIKNQSARTASHTEIERWRLCL
jgi:hypothetical protein